MRSPRLQATGFGEKVEKSRFRQTYFHFCVADFVHWLADAVVDRRCAPAEDQAILATAISPESLAQLQMQVKCSDGAHLSASTRDGEILPGSRVNLLRPQAVGHASAVTQETARTRRAEPRRAPTRSSLVKQRRQALAPAARNSRMDYSHAAKRTQEERSRCFLGGLLERANR
jgi:hypothetical protein